MPQGITIHTNTDHQVLQDLQTTISHKWPEWQHRFILLLHDNACAHLVTKIQNLLRQFVCTVFQYPMYSSNLALSDYHLFPES